jgi:NitT/TauT family transport system substrate-binding protein
MKIAVPDLISNSYFPVIAAVELGFFKEEGLDAEIELMFPVTKAMEELRGGTYAFVGGAAHAPLHAFPDWKGAKLLCALAQHMYWFMVLRADLGVKRGDIAAVTGLRIGAAPGPDAGLRRLLREVGVTDVEIGPVPGTGTPSANFGVMAAEALGDRKIDGFWANGMGTEVAVRRGIGTVVLDVRRGDGPAAAQHYTFPALVTTDALIQREPEVVRAAIRAVVKAQDALKADPSRATEVGRRLFPPSEAKLIAELIRRDLPYYSPGISPESVVALNQFAIDMGMLSGQIAYKDVVWKPM